jgi:2-polyprenyl-6-methoxyphenol hydroxylase-like FAD-dependent oxidoreductase
MFSDAQDGAQSEAAYDLLVGADGVNSTVRDILRVRSALPLSTTCLQADNSVGATWKAGTRPYLPDRHLATL